MTTPRPPGHRPDGFGPQPAGLSPPPPQGQPGEQGPPRQQGQAPQHGAPPPGQAGPHGQPAQQPAPGQQQWGAYPGAPGAAGGLWQPQRGQQSGVHPAPGSTSLGSWALPPVLAVVATVLSLTIKESKHNAFDDHIAWAIFAIVSVAALLAPVIGALMSARAATTWRIAALGTAGITAYWLLLALPSVESNQGFGLTVGTAAAGLGLWLAPGRPD